MSSNVEKLLGQVEKFEKIATDSLEKTAEKLDPKAKVRNRGTVCVPAESAKDKKDHFPINNEAQARNALARVNQFSKVPDWYSGSLQSLVNLVARKVKAKYPSIEVSKEAKKPGAAKKKSAYYDALLEKYSQESLWDKVKRPYTTNPFSKEQIEKMKNLNPFGGTRATPPPPGGYGLVQPPANVEDPNAPTPTYARPKASDAPAEREDMPTVNVHDLPDAKPTKAPAAKPSGYYFIPEVQEFQKWVVSQGSNELGPAGADGKLGPKTIASLLKRFPNPNNDSDKALQDWMAYKAKMGYGKPATPQPGTYDPKLGF